MPKIIALEETTNTHKIKAKNVKKIHEDGSTILIQVKGDGVVSHGEHGTIITESPFVLKYVQKEVNPITQKIEDAND